MVRTENGQPWFIHGVAFDVTEMMRAEASLEEAQAELEARVAERTAQLALSNAELGRAMEAAQSANRAKSNFLATISHEIRTPMNGVLGMTQVLLGTALSQEQREAALTIQQSADALLTIINDILDLSKIEAASWNWNPLYSGCPTSSMAFCDSWRPARRAPAYGCWLFILFQTAR